MLKTKKFGIIKGMKNIFSKKTEGNKESQAEEYAGVGYFILEIIKIVVLAFIIIMPIRTFLFQPFFVQGSSMEPNFEDSQYLIINELGFKETDVRIGSYSIFKVESFRDLERQDVVVFRYPLDNSKFFIKRIIGLPGEKVQIKNGLITIFNSENPEGFVLDEKEYLPLGLKTKGEVNIEIKENEYFVLGDNRGASSDSRSWGTLPKSDMIGKVIFRAWPFDKISVY